MMLSALKLTPTPDGRPGHYDLVCGTLSYSIVLRPETSVALGDLLRRMQPALLGRPDPAGQTPAADLLRTVGERLWQALLPDSATAAERVALARTLNHSADPLCLVLPPILSFLPWELLCDPAQPHAGALALRRPFVRLLPQDHELAPLVPPVHVLVLISSPPGLPIEQQTDVESERAMVEEATRTLREQGLLHLQIEDIVTSRRVQQALLGFQPHILHYIGHGGYADGVGGVLTWEDDRGQPANQSETQLANLLRPRGLRAVLLHACDTAASHRQADFGGIAGALLAAGIPAVLAQQAKLTYESSQRASEMFYTALTTGQGLADAVFEARQALAQADRPDWAVPLLYATEPGLTPLLDAGASPGAPDPMLVRPHMVADLPAPTGVFVGRQRELRALRMFLESPAGSGPVMALITGPGGVGKSTLVAQAVGRHASGYKAVLTLSCRSYQSVDLFLQRLGELLQPTHPNLLDTVLPDSQRSLDAKLRTVVDALNAAGPFLLIVDNLESVQTTDRTLDDPGLLLLMQSLLTNLRHGRVLITGRYAVEGLLPEGRFAAHLLPLDLDDLHSFEIERLFDRHHTLAHLDEVTRATLVREFGGLPYVYDLLSSKAASQSLQALIRDIQGRITAERRQRSAAEWAEVRQQVVEFAALEETVARLPETARRLLGQLSVFNRPFPLDAMEQGLGATRAGWQPLLDGALLRHDGTEATYRLHSLTARFAADHLLDETHRTAAQMSAAEWYLNYRFVSHDLADALEAHRLYRAAGAHERAGELANSLLEALERFGLQDVWRALCRGTIQDNPETAFAAEAGRQLGVIAQHQGNYAEAERLYGEALAAFERLGNQSGRAATLGQLGMLAQAQGDYDRAQQLYAEILDITQRRGDDGVRANALHQLGSIGYAHGEYAEARRLYGESLMLNEQLGNQLGQARTLHQLGMVAQDQGDYAEAWRLYGEGLVVFERLGDQRGRASAMVQQGSIAQEWGNYAEGRRLYGEALTTFERLGDQVGQARVKHQMGNLAFAQSDYEEARQFYDESLAIKEQLGDQRGSARTLLQLGIVAQAQSDYPTARRLYGEALAIFERLGDQRDRAGVVGQLGNMAQVQGDYAEAGRLYGESLAAFEQLGDQANQARTWLQLGMLARVRSDYAEAGRLFGQALTVFERLGDQRLRASALEKLGLIACAQGNYSLAGQFYGTSLAIRQQLGDERGQASVLAQLGLVAQFQGQYAEAERLYGQVLAIFERLGDQDGRARTLGPMGALAHRQGDYAAALRYTLEALSIFERLRSPNQGLALQKLAEIRRDMGENAFSAAWYEIAGDRPLPEQNA